MKGTCHLCGRFGDLTFEHTPPRRAYNDRPIILTKFEEWESGCGSEYLREGRGAHTLCERCNNFTGGSYGQAFVQWCYQGFQLIEHTVDRPAQRFHGDIYPLRVLKQIATIFFSVNGPQFRGKNEELAEFVLSKDRKGLSPDYQFHVFWYGGGSIRQAGVTGVMDLNRDRLSTLAEFVHPPFGYVLALSGDLLDPRPENVSDFARYDYDDIRRINRRIPVLPTHWKMPGDYRSLEQIHEDEARNVLDAKGVLDPDAAIEAYKRAGS